MSRFFVGFAFFLWVGVAFGETSKWKSEYEIELKKSMKNATCIAGDFKQCIEIGDKAYKAGELKSSLKIYLYGCYKAKDITIANELCRRSVMALIVKLLKDNPKYKKKKSKEMFTKEMYKKHKEIRESVAISEFSCSVAYEKSCYSQIVKVLDDLGFKQRSNILKEKLAKLKKK